MAKKSKKQKKEEIEWIKKSILIFVVGSILIVGGTLLFVTSQNGDHSVEIEIKSSETEITRGVPFEVDVEISNRTTSDLEDAELVLVLSQSLINLDSNNENNLTIENIGNVSSNSLDKRTFTILPTGGSESEQNIEARLSYSIGSARFQSEDVLDIEIEESPFDITIEKPDQITGGSEFEVEVSYENKTDFNFENLILEMEYPQSFEYSSSSLEPESLNNRWVLGALNSGSKGLLKIRGKMSETLNRYQPFRVMIYKAHEGNEYKIGETTDQTVTSESPLRLNISSEGLKDSVAGLGDSVIYKINYSNRSDVSLKDVEIRAKIEGEMFDLNTLNSDGVYNEEEKNIIWNEERIEELENLEPGEGGTVSLSINVKDSFPIGKASDKNFMIGISTEIESPTVPYYLNSEKSFSSTKLENKVKGSLSLDAKGFFRDAGSGIINSGNMPPEVGEITQYTIRWDLVNYSTDVRNVLIKTTLPEGVEWTGVVKSDLEIEPEFNESSREVTWEIPNLKATRGLLTSPIKAVFQIQINPSEEFIGEYHPLIGETSIRAIDEWTGLELTDTDLLINTRLLDDPTVSAFDGIVQ